MKKFTNMVSDAIELSQQLTQKRGMKPSALPTYDDNNGLGTARKHSGINGSFVPKNQANQILRQLRY